MHYHQRARPRERAAIQPLVLIAERGPYPADPVEYFYRTEGYAMNIGNRCQPGAASLRFTDLVIIVPWISASAGFRLCAVRIG